MSIIDRYLIKEILKHFGIVLAAAVGIYLSVDFFENVDKFVNAGLTVYRMVQFFQLKLPMVVAQITPVVVLLAVLITFGLMNKNNEIIALKSGGLSVYYLLKPIFLLGFCFSLLLFFVAEIIVPITISKANEIWRIEVKKYTETSVQKNIWYKGHRSISYIAYFNPRTQSISGITLNYFNQDFRLVRRVDADRGEFRQGRWVIYDMMEQLLNRETGSYEVQFQKEKIEETDFLPDDLQRVARRSEEMSFKELYYYIKDIEAEGYDATSYRVDLYGKFALPSACLIICIIGAGVSIRKQTKEGLSMSIILGIGVVFLYWVSNSFCMSLGYGGMLPPFIAAWISNFIFSCIAIFNLLNAE